MAAQPETVTYVFIFNESDFVRLDELNHQPVLYVHGLTDIVLLTLLVIISFLCNAILVMTVASHRYLRKQPFYVLLLALAGIFIVDCMFNGALSLAYMSRITWPLGSAMCIVNAFAIQLVLAVVPWLIVQAAVDRYVCLCHPTTYRQRFTVTWQVATTGIILTLAILAGLPYLAGFLPVLAFPARMACGAANVAASQHAYTCAAVLLVLQTVVPGVAILVFSLFFAHALISSRRERQRVQARSWLRTESMPVSSDVKPTLSHHDTRTLCVWLVAGGYYAAAILPYAVLSAVQQMSWSAIEDEVESQEVCRMPNTDAFLAWMHYLATWVHPVAVLSLHDDIRQEALALLTWWKSSSASSDSEVLPPANSISLHSKWNSFGLLRRNDGNLAVQADALTAVLFPSPNGLFLRHPIGGSASQFDYALCDNFSECCFHEKKSMSDLQKNARDTGHRSVASTGKAVKVISDGEYVNSKKKKLSKKFRSSKTWGRANKVSKFPSSKVVPKIVNGSRKPENDNFKPTLRKQSNPNASAIISAEPIRPYRN